VERSSENLPLLDLIPEAIISIHYSPFKILMNKAFIKFSTLTKKIKEIDAVDTGFEILDLLGLNTNPGERSKVLKECKTLIKEFHQVSVRDDLIDIECSVRPIQTSSADNKLSGVFIILKDITAVKSSLDSLKEQSNFLVSLVNSVPIPFFFKNKAGKYLFANKAYEDFSMMPAKEVIGKTVFDLYPERLARRYTEADLTTYRSEKPYAYETIIPHRDGTYHNVIISKTLYKDASDIIKGTLGSIIDYTRLRQTEQSFKHRFNFEKILLEISSSFINIPSEAVDNYIEVSLRIITDFTGVNSIFLYRCDNTGSEFQLTHKFFRVENLDSAIELSDFYPENLPFLINQVNENQVINIKDPALLPIKAIKEKALMSKYAYSLLVSVPISFHSKVSGFICLYAVENKRAFTSDDLHLIHFIGEIFFMALERKKYTDQLIFRDKAMQSVIEIQEKFYTSDPWIENVRFMLSEIGSMLQAEYSFIAEFKHEVLVDSLNYIAGCRSFSSDKGTQVSALREIESEFYADNKIFEFINTKKILHKVSRCLTSSIINYSKNQSSSLLLVPILNNGQVWGVHGLLKHAENNEGWKEAEIELLKIISSFIGLSIEKKDTLNELIESEEKFRNIFQNTSDPVSISDFNGEVLLANDNFYKHFRNTSINNPIQSLFDVIHKDDHKAVRKRLKLLKNNKTTAVAEYKYDLGNDRQGILEINSQPILYNQRRAIISVFRDITERKGQERKLVEAIIQTEERERQRFAADLHDDLGPLLSGIKLYLNEISSQAIKREKRAELIRYLEEIVEDAIAKTRIISGNMMPNVLIDYGLESAIRSFILKINKVYPVKINFYSHEFKERLDSTIEIVIYRIIIELLNNSIKHAVASTILIQIQEKDNRYNLLYQDDGVGFSLRKKLLLPEGNGLLSMLNRLASIDGTYKFSSRKNMGAKYDISFPKNY
jgi:PAS domain S-box-containing protein